VALNTQFCLSWVTEGIQLWMDKALARDNVLLIILAYTVLHIQSTDHIDLKQKIRPNDSSEHSEVCGRIQKQLLGHYVSLVRSDGQAPLYLRSRTALCCGTDIRNLRALCFPLSLQGRSIELLCGEGLQDWAKVHPIQFVGKAVCWTPDFTELRKMMKTRGLILYR